ncbi:MAG: AAA family ATPase [Pseudomonadota bacterium]|nr:AAA family ATPase [Pseudomonadota bacterium]
MSRSGYRWIGTLGRSGDGSYYDDHQADRDDVASVSTEATDPVTTFVRERLQKVLQSVDLGDGRKLVVLRCPNAACVVLNEVLMENLDRFAMLPFMPDMRDALRQMEKASLVVMASPTDEISLHGDAVLDFVYTEAEATEIFEQVYGVRKAIGCPTLEDLRRVIVTTTAPDKVEARLAAIASETDAAETERKRKEEEADRSRAAREERERAKGAENLHTELHRPVSPRASDLTGYGEAGVWAMDLATDVSALKDGRIGAEDLDRGALLYGPPGTGKTLLARAIAAEAGIPMILGGYSIWLDSKDARGDTAIRMIREAFRAARANAPAILFIDEIDSFGSRGQNGNNESWFRPFITTLLQEIDGAMSTAGVIVIAATNDRHSVDPALRRAGRLDRAFEIGLPDEAALKGILRHHLGGVDDVAIETVAAALAGSVSGADIAKIARETRRKARRSGNAPTAAMLIESALPADERPDEERWRIAVHEAGHAIIGAACGRMPEVLSIVAKDRSGGYVRFEGTVSLLPGVLEASVLTLLGGRVGELIVLGECSAGAAGDLSQATSLISADESAGMGNWLSVGDVSRSVVERRLQRLHAEATLIAMRHRQDIVDLANLAMDKRVLSNNVLRKFFVERHRKFSNQEFYN